MPGDPADPARCHVEDGPAISASTAQMIACAATWSWMLHDSAGKLLDLGRRRRRPSTALRRAARERDKCRCRFPGCESRRVDLHHIQYWSNGGRTTLDNLISLCRYHHQVIHDRGYLIAAARDGTFTFYQPGGTPVPACPALPQADGTIEDGHDADITPETIIPAWYGERLDLDHAIYICFANAANAAEQARQQGNGLQPAPAAQPDTATQPDTASDSQTRPAGPTTTSRSGPSSGSSSRRTGCPACAVTMPPTETATAGASRDTRPGRVTCGWAAATLGAGGWWGLARDQVRVDGLGAGG